MLPLLAIAAGVGAARAGAGIIAGNKAAKRSGRLIRDAYEINQKQMGIDQGHTRQNSLESLNARGILNAGATAHTAPLDPRGGVPVGAAPTFANMLAMKRGQKAAGAQRFGIEGAFGETGAAGTLAGQTQHDLSDQFTLERRDLWNQRQSGIAGVKADHRQNTINSLAAGAQTGASIYSAFAGAPEAGLSATDAATVSAPATLGSIGGPQASIRGAFGLSPVDGTGTPMIAQPGTDVYNFHV